MSIVDTAKDIYDLLGKGANIEQQERLMQLRQEALELQEENLALRERVKELEQMIAAVEEVEFDGRAYWRVAGESKDGPFCQQCFDSTGKLIRLQKNGGPDWNGYWYDCHTCKSRFDEL